MRRVSKIAPFAIASALLLGITGCSAGTSENTDEQKPTSNALSKLDPCTILKPEKSGQVGLPAQGEPNDSIRSQPGCYYNGDYAGIGIYRLAEESFDEYSKRPGWSEFKKLKINGRDGAEVHADSWTDNQCLTAISAGGGVVTVQSNAADPRKPFDACGESTKVAKLIEPDLPK